MQRVPRIAPNHPRQLDRLPDKRAKPVTVHGQHLGYACRDVQPRLRWPLVRRWTLSNVMWPPSGATTGLPARASGGGRK